MAILVKRWIWSFGEASAGELLRLKPAQQACIWSIKMKFSMDDKYVKDDKDDKDDNHVDNNNDNEYNGFNEHLDSYKKDQSN